MVRAKFNCTKIEETVDGKTVVLAPVTSGSEENKSFFRWTPSGECVLRILNPAASSQFEVGKSYYLDFTAAKAAPAPA